MLQILLLSEIKVKIKNMNTMYLLIVGFLFLLAIFDLWVGVSNDAVNFLNSSIGSKAAKFKTILIVAALGIICGAVMSNGMMDIARHGIFQPSQFTFHEVMCIFTAMMITDIILLDIFNSLGLPTSTTVSMVFELLGGAFVLSIIKIIGDSTGALSLGDLLNSDKALTVILSIFLSVAIAFFFGIIVQWISRIIFSFNYIKTRNRFAGLFGGISTTALFYFILVKGLEGSPYIPTEWMTWMNSNLTMIMIIAFITLTVIMQVLTWLRFNIFRFIVLLGTFALAMAFAGNDLVNFIGVPLAGYSSFLDYTASGATNPDAFMMTSLESSAKTPFLFLFIAGLIMIYSLFTSKKAQHVTQTEVGLSRQDEGDEMFGSSQMARTLVHSANSFESFIIRILPESIRNWIDSRFNKNDIILADGAAYDLIRASVNLVLAGSLIIMGTSLKLPLSTTYVTFMVAMGTSLADRAWGRESAVFRITGMLSVIGGWFITAGVAFAISAIAVVVIFYGGPIVTEALIIVAVCIVIYSNRKFVKKQKEEKGETSFQKLIHTKDKEEALQLFHQGIDENESNWLAFVQNALVRVTDGFIQEDRKAIRRSISDVNDERKELKSVRRRDLIALRHIDAETAIESTTWVFLGSTSAEQMLFSLRHIADPCKEHLDNNFNPLPNEYIREYLPLRDRTVSYFQRGREIITNHCYDDLSDLLSESDAFKEELSKIRQQQLERIRNEKVNMRTAFVYLTILQENQELVSSFRHLMRANSKLRAIQESNLPSEPNMQLSPA